MQNFNQIDVHFPRPVAAERTVTSGALILFVSLVLVVLAFIPLAPPDDAIKGGGLTARGMIEFGLLLGALFLMATYAKSRDGFSFDLRNPSFVVISSFVFWAVISSIWSPNPILTIAKGAEMWGVMIAAIMFVTLAGRTHPDRKQRKQLETTLARALITALCILIVVNLVLWGTPLPTTGNESLPLHLFGEEVPELVERPRLILAYAHPLLTGDFLALSIICLSAAGLSKVFKAIGMPILLGLLWMADARGPSIAVVAALVAMIVLQLKRNSVRAIVTMMVISLSLAIALVFQNSLLKPISSLLTDDVYTLNSRTDLWMRAFEFIAQQPIVGYGYYSSRYLLMKDFIWAGHAHNSFIEVLLTTGLVGLILLCIYFIYLGRAAVTTGNCLLLGAFVYTLIQGMLNPLLFTPGLPMFVLCIAAVNASKSGSGDFVEGHQRRQWEAQP